MLYRDKFNIKLLKILTDIVNLASITNLRTLVFFVETITLTLISSQYFHNQFSHNSRKKDLKKRTFYKNPVFVFSSQLSSHNVAEKDVCLTEECLFMRNKANSTSGVTSTDKLYILFSINTVKVKTYL